jgi:two-component system chemotaxis response regulator CheB
MVSVLVVEDSAVLREILTDALNRDPEIAVVGSVENGKEAIEFALATPPDVITMDMKMPVMDGVAATRRIMQEHPLPIVVVHSTWADTDEESVREALAAGAVSAVQKPLGLGDLAYATFADRLCELVKQAAGNGVSATRTAAR